MNDNLQRGTDGVFKMIELPVRLASFVFFAFVLACSPARSPQNPPVANPTSVGASPTATPANVATLPVRLPTSNILCRVFHLAFPAGISDKLSEGSGFAVEVDGREYLVTAKHVEAPSSGNVVGVMYQNTYRRLEYERIQVDPASVDIVVLAVSERLVTADFPIRLNIAGTMLSEEVFFFGYASSAPAVGDVVNGGHPLPLVKRGIISYFAGTDGGPFLIDAVNTYGFSGGPVVRIDGDGIPRVLGVVSGFWATAERVFEPSENSKPVNEIHDGHKKPPKEIGTTAANSGLTLAYSISYALSAIQHHPIGGPAAGKQ